MKPSCKLLLCFLGTLCAASAAAQTMPVPAPQTTFTLTQPKSLLFTTPSTIPALIAAPFPTQPAPTFTFRSNAPQAAVALTKPIQQSNLCFKMRTYGASNVEDMKPNAPTPPPTTCTDSAAAQMKSADLPSHR